MNTHQKLRDQLVTMLKQGNAFTPLGPLLESLPYAFTGQKVEGFSHTIWELTEHIRLALHDLTEYSKDSYYASPPWPEGYWPLTSYPASEADWQASVNHIHQLFDEMISWIQDPQVDLFEPFAAHPDHHLLRQATIAAEHCAYHTGQIAMLYNYLQTMEQQK